MTSEKLIEFATKEKRKKLEAVYTALTNLDSLSCFFFIGGSKDEAISCLEASLKFNVGVEGKELKKIKKIKDTEYKAILHSVTNSLAVADICKRFEGKELTGTIEDMFLLMEKGLPEKDMVKFRGAFEKEMAQAKVPKEIVMYLLLRPNHFLAAVLMAKR